MSKVSLVLVGVTMLLKRWCVERVDATAQRMESRKPMSDRGEEETKSRRENKKIK